MKRILVYLLALGLSLPAFGGMSVRRRGGVAVAPECPSPVTKISQTTGSSDSNNLYDVNTMGQSFTPGSTFDLYSITFSASDPNGACASAPGCTATVRVDDDNDMSSEYIEQTTVAVTGVATFEAIFTGTPTLTNGVTYYVSFHVPDFADRFKLIYAAGTNPYAGGQYLYGTTTAFLIDNAGEPTHDIYFVVKSCS